MNNNLSLLIIALYTIINIYNNIVTMTAWRVRGPSSDGFITTTAISLWKCQIIIIKNWRRGRGRQSNSDLIIIHITSCYYYYYYYYHYFHYHSNNIDSLHGGAARLDDGEGVVDGPPLSSLIITLYTIIIIYLYGPPQTLSLLIITLYTINNIITWTACTVGRRDLTTARAWSTVHPYLRIQ